MEIPETLVTTRGGLRPLGAALADIDRLEATLAHLPGQAPRRQPVDAAVLDGWLAAGSVPGHAEIGMFGEMPPVPAMMSAHLQRERVVLTHGYAIPCREALDAVAALSPLVEVGAGTGYWSALLRRRGADVIPTDPDRLGHPTATGRILAPEPLDGEEAVRRYPERNVLMVWPSADDDWPERVVRAMAPGRFLAAVTEASCGTKGFYEALELLCDVVGDAPLPRWPCMRDRLVVYRRR